MALKLVQINFTHRQGQTKAAQKAAWERAHQIAEWPGLLWKIWIYSASEQRAGGIYLFTDEASAKAYIAGPIVSHLRAAPGVEDMSIQLFDVDAARTALTRGPIPAEEP